MLTETFPSASGGTVPHEPHIPQLFLDFIKEGDKFLVAGHMEPDGDCVTSQLALASALRRMGKQAILCSAGPFKRPEINSYAPLFTAAPDEQARSGARVIIVDCSTPDRTGDLAPFLEGLPAAVIDHHNTPPPSEWPAYKNISAMSTTFLVLQVIKALGLQPSKEEAELLFFGICTDTGFFRHVDSASSSSAAGDAGGNIGAETFQAAADLIRAGANPKAAFAEMYGGKSFGSRKLIGHVLLRAESLFDGKLILSAEEYEETCRFGKEGRDSDTLYQILQSIGGVEAIVIIRQESPENCSVGFRSKDWVDVRSIAESFGGGGHKNAAGLYIQGTIAELTPRIVQAFEAVFS
ncbi:MAG: bifunctional oligoribonuclease/PAP phosphatase NrnA [Treponema sp.]|nr:bifunctional oligoribonuclease/PAP phosphatase NrnA [Treponema sp.]